MIKQNTNLQEKWLLKNKINLLKVSKIIRIIVIKCLLFISIYLSLKKEFLLQKQAQFF